MPIDFPDSPTTDQIYSSGNRSWIYDGTAWVSRSITAGTGSITTSEIASNTIVNADINSAAAIALSKLASGSSAQILMANATGVPTYTTVSGDVTISSSGVASITANPSFDGVTADGVRIGITASTEIDTTAGNLVIDSAGGTVTVDDNLVVSGNLTVSGTTTSINTETLTVDDNLIILNNNETGSPSQNAGIEVNRGSSNNVSLRWNETDDIWEFTNDGTTYQRFLSDTIINAQVSSYTLVSADRSKMVEMGVGSANTLTVPTNNSVPFPVGTTVTILQTGAGQTTVAGANGSVTINATPGLKLRAQWSSAMLIKRATDTWVLIGDLSA